ncbi:biotin/lipoate--protein ligase family protein [Pseudophaeobacter leonis]|uniref:biotin/lipoate--protein ligase family protein n=1 Tax=Pseudophaeobacter leonis TaxID=1144477 RepID=UPI0009F6C837|nr:biotin/lipoate--protein ligase family protein [Pseudophaeobacter leonis]
MSDPAFPPLMSGLAVTGQEDPFETACQRAVLGCDAGLVVHNLAPDCLRAALVFAPEVPLSKAMAMLPTCGIGLQNALGALAPPEVAVHLEWGGGLRINGARCGTLRVAASTTDPNEVPDWLVVGLQLPLWPASEDGGETPDETALYAEGCADVKAPALLESWARHTLHWISRWEEDGLEPLHAEWRGLAHGLGEDGTWYGATGTFLGVDEDFGMLLRDQDTTHLIPLTTRLETL